MSEGASEWPERPRAGIGDSASASLDRRAGPEDLHRRCSTSPTAWSRSAARPIPKVPALRGKTVVSLFYEDSTRTRLSFETAAKRLSADTMTFSVSIVRVKKGESLRDTVETHRGHGRRRHRRAPRARPACRGRSPAGSTASVVNAGDGWHEHPTQALLDSYTIRPSLARSAVAERPRRGCTSASSATSSTAGWPARDVLAFTAARRRGHAGRAADAAAAERGRLGAGADVAVSHDLDDVLPKLDVVYLLRMQLERQEQALVPSLREYTARYGLTPERAARLPGDALVMHPGPMNRGVEIAPEVADLPNAVIIDQVANGVAVRMAVLYRLLGPGVAAVAAPATAGPEAPPMADVVIKGGDGSSTPAAGAAGRRRGRATAASSPSGADLDGGRTVLDAGGCVVAPGLVDLHTHLRQPGREEAETIETGSRAAALGGYTAVVAMPNTDAGHRPRRRGPRGAGARPGRACATCASPAPSPSGGRGEQLAPMAEMAALGVRLFTDDGTGVQDARLMRRALEYAGGLGVRARPALRGRRPRRRRRMHEGEWSSRLGIPGPAGRGRGADGHARPRAGPPHRRPGALPAPVDGRLGRDGAGGRGRRAAGHAPRRRPTTSRSPTRACAAYDPVFKVNPPLRTDADVAAVRAGLADGTIDAIATDHAPHAPAPKEVPFDQAPPGMLGLETALALALTELDLPIERVLALLSWRPAAIAGLADEHGGPIEPRAARPTSASSTPPPPGSSTRPRSASRARNTPYAGRTLRGRVRHTLLGGEPVVVDGEAQR